MAITALPDPPSTSDPTNFATKADAFLAALAVFVTETNAVAAAMNLNSTTDTSSSSVAIGTGSKTFTVSSGKSFQPGMFLVIADTAAPSTNSMYGQITSYAGTTLIVNVLSVLGSGTKSAWNISLTGAASQEAAKLNSTEVDVTAHATTGDIFGASSNSILWNDAAGTVVTTDFADAAQAGMVATLRLNNTSSFTSNANLLIEGHVSGRTIKLGAGAKVWVRALTTNIFKLTYSYSGSFTITATGFSGTAPSTTAYFKVENGIAHISLNIASGYLSGTSNLTTFTLTGLPDCLNAGSDKVLNGLMRGMDNSAVVYTISAVFASSVPNVIRLDLNGSSTGWTAANIKHLAHSEFTYSLN